MTPNLILDFRFWNTQFVCYFFGAKNEDSPRSVSNVRSRRDVRFDEQTTSLEFFNIVNFVLDFCPTDPTDIEFMKRFAKIGGGGGMTFDPAKLSPEMKTVEQGRADAWEAIAGGVKELEEGKLTAGDVFGTHQAMQNNYLNRWFGGPWASMATRSRGWCIRSIGPTPADRCWQGPVLHLAVCARPLILPSGEGSWRPPAIVQAN